MYFPMTIKMEKKGASYLINRKEQHAFSNNLFYQLLVSDNIERKKMILPHDIKEDTGMMKGRKGVKLGVNSSALLSPRKGWHVLNDTSGKSGVRNEDLFLYFL